MNEEIKGACIGVWMKEPLDNAFKTVLLKYADYINAMCVSFTIRFQEHMIKSVSEESQIINAIGYRPKEEIVLCGFFDSIFYAAEEILLKFGGYLQAGAPEDVIPTINGEAHKIWYDEEIDYDYDGTTEITRRSYHLLDGNFVKNYFNVRRDPAVLRIFSLDEYMIRGVRLIDLLSKGLNN
jgi:hypothetical protein